MQACGEQTIALLSRLDAATIDGINEDCLKMLAQFTDRPKIRKKQQHVSAIALVMIDRQD